MVTLYCGVARVAGSAFPVTIDATLSVGLLKKVIKEKKMYQFPADQLQLFLAKKAYGRWLTEADVAQGVQDADGLTQLVSARAEIGDVGLSEDDVRVQVTKKEIAALKGPVNVLVVVPEGASASGSAVATVSSKKRKLVEISDLITPSSFAKCKGAGSWVKWLKKLNGQIECHRVEGPGDEAPLPNDLRKIASRSS